MIIESFSDNKKNLWWTIFHILLGALCTINAFGLVIWFYLIFVLNFGKSFRLLSSKNITFFLLLFSYLISFEVLDRMAKTSPYIPYELGKYMLVFMGIMGIYIYGIKSMRGFIMFLMILPALFYDFSGLRNNFDIINYLLGPLAIGLGITFVDKINIREESLDLILKSIYWTCLSSLIYTFIKTPDFDEIEFTLKAQFETTGGHSSNQVSTILGL